MSLFVGRQDELSVLEGALREAASGHFTVAVVLGAAGIGKTALVRTFVDRVARSPCRADGRCPQVYWAEAAGDDAPGTVPGGTTGAAPSGGARLHPGAAWPGCYAPSTPDRQGCTATLWRAGTAALRERRVRPPHHRARRP